MEQAQDETMQTAAGQFVATASLSIVSAIAELRTASMQVAAHEAAARTAAGQAQHAARAAEALIEHVRRVVVEETGRPPRREAGQNPNRQRRDPPGSTGAA